MIGMCSRELSTAYFCTVLTMVAHASGVLTAGLPPPPDRIEPAELPTSTFFMQDSVSAPPLHWQSPCMLPTEIWSIWPIFSSRVILLRRSLTRRSMGAFALVYVGLSPASAGTDARAATHAALVASVRRPLRRMRLALGVRRSFAGITGVPSWSGSRRTGPVAVNVSDRRAVWPPLSRIVKTVRRRRFAAPLPPGVPRCRGPNSLWQNGYFVNIRE